jgi:hypothetical protein
MMFPGTEPIHQAKDSNGRNGGNANEGNRDQHFTMAGWSWQFGWSSH